MKIKLFLIIAAVAGLCSGAKAQDVPNYYVAGQLSMIIQKIGLPVDSAQFILKATTQRLRIPQEPRWCINQTLTRYIFHLKKMKAAISP